MLLPLLPWSHSCRIPRIENRLESGPLSYNTGNGDKDSDPILLAPSSQLQTIRDQTQKGHVKVATKIK